MGLIDLIKHRLNPRTIAKEMDAGVVRLASQGAAEAAQALFSGNPYVPYGPTEKPMPVVEPMEDYNKQLEKLADRLPEKPNQRGMER
jgi:hypothetical protein